MFVQESIWDPWLVDMMADPQFGYIRGYHLGLWVIAIACMYIAAAIFWGRSRKEGMFESQIWVFRSFALFFILMGVTRISFVIAYWVEPYYNLLLAIGYTFGAFSLLPLIATLEKYILIKTHHFFTIVGIILSVISFYFLFVPYESDLSREIQNLGMPILLAAFLILYLWMIKISTGMVRTKAIMTLLGMFVLTLGIILDGEGILESGLSIWVSPPIFIAGILIILMTQKMD